MTLTLSSPEPHGLRALPPLSPSAARSGTLTMQGLCLITLFCLITLGAAQKASASIGAIPDGLNKGQTKIVSLPSDRQGVSCCSVVLEGVRVIDPSPHDNSVRAGSQTSHFRDSDVWHFGNICRCLSTRQRNSHDCLSFGINKYGLQRSGWGPTDDTNVGHDDRIICGRLAGIFHVYGSFQDALIVDNRRSRQANMYVGPQLADNSIGGFLRGIGGALADSYSATQPISLRTEGEELKERKPREDFSVERKIAIVIDKLPVQFRFFSAIFFVLCGLCLFWRAGNYSYNDRRLLSTSLIGGGCLLGLLGWLLWFMPLPGAPL